MFKSLCQLVRLPNVFTVVADVLLGYLFVHPSLSPLAPFACLLLSSVCLYWAGMALNDVFDVEQDTRERPERPIPSGRIFRRTAAIIGGGLLLSGVLLGTLAGHVTADVELPWRSGLLAVCVAICVLAYDGPLKRTWLGPLLMGACRGGNVLLGMSTGVVVHDYAVGVTGFDPAQLAVAGGLGVYVAGITWFARHEASQPQRSGLTGGLLLMMLGWAWLASFTMQDVCQAGRYDLTVRHEIWPLIVLFLAVPILRRVLTVIVSPSPDRIQAAVRSCILSLIVFDAAVCWAIRSPWGWSVLVLSMMVPTVLLGRLFYST